MPGIIGRSGFGVIELLVSLVIVMARVVTLLKTHRRKAGSNPVAGAVATQMKEDLEKRGPVVLTSLEPEVLEGSNDRGTFRYGVTGTLPNRTFVVGEAPLAERVVSLRFTAYDKNERFLPDRPSAEELPGSRRIKVELFTHDEKEDPALLTVDSTRGIDLDGDPGNGTARVRETTLIFDLNSSK